MRFLLTEFRKSGLFWLECVLHLNINFSISISSVGLAAAAHMPGLNHAFVRRCVGVFMMVKPSGGNVQRGFLGPVDLSLSLALPGHTP